MAATTGRHLRPPPLERRRAAAAQARLRPGALPGDGRLRQLRDLVHDHLDPRGLPHVLFHRVQQRRPGRGHLGLAAGRRLLHHRRARAWPRSRRRCPTAGGLYYWASEARAAPGWGWFTGWFNLIGQISVTAAIDYGAATFVSSLFNLWFDMSLTKEHVFIVYTVDHPAAPGHQPLRPAGAQPAQHRLGLVAHGRRGDHRPDPDRHPGSAPVRLVRVHQDDQRLRASRAPTSRASCSGSYSASGC